MLVQPSTVVLSNNVDHMLYQELHIVGNNTTHNVTLHHLRPAIQTMLYCHVRQKLLQSMHYRLYYNDIPARLPQCQDCRAPMDESWPILESVSSWTFSTALLRSCSQPARPGGAEASCSNGLSLPPRAVGREARETTHSSSVAVVWPWRLSLSPLLASSPSGPAKCFLTLAEIQTSAG